MRRYSKGCATKTSPQTPDSGRSGASGLFLSPFETPRLFQRAAKALEFSDFEVAPVLHNQGPVQGAPVSALPIALSVFVGLALGMLGGGGSILVVPLLVYGAGMADKEAIATSLLVVSAVQEGLMRVHEESAS